MLDEDRPCCRCQNPVDYSLTTVLSCPKKTQEVSTYGFVAISTLGTLYYIAPVYFWGAVGALATSAFVYNYYSYSFNAGNTFESYMPVAQNLLEASFKKILFRDVEIKYADQAGGKILVTEDKPNFIVLGPGNDTVRASLCKLSKVTDKYVDTVYGFNPEEDKLNLHCTKKDVSIEDIEIISYNNYKTCIEIQGVVDKSVICLLGDFDKENIDIIFN